jgi:hypothetical protein
MAVISAEPAFEDPLLPVLPPVATRYTRSPGAAGQLKLTLKAPLELVCAGVVRSAVALEA